jgi:hydroxyethylthiazole kinase
MRNRGGDSVIEQQIYPMLEKVRQKNPLIHIVMNMVAAQNAANAVLQVGGSPVMADAEIEVEEIVSHADALVLNTGMLNPQKLRAMVAAAMIANQMNIPVILDPVGVAASTFRQESVLYLLENSIISILRGNGSEIAWAAGQVGTMRGVDTDRPGLDAPDLVYSCARKWGVTAALTGKQDVISDGREIWTIDNGHPYMAKISGFGCMATAVIGAFAAIAENYAESVLAALTCFGIAGDLAAQQSAGPGSFLYGFLDCLYHLSPSQVVYHARIERLRQGRN